MFSQNPCSVKCFHIILFCGSLGFNFSTGRDADRGKATYIRISPDPAKEGPTMGGVVVVVVVYNYWSLIMNDF